MANRSITINSTETLLSRLERLESQALKDALTAQEGQRVERKVRINGSDVSFTVTPTVQPGRIYRLFRVNGQKVAKTEVARKLLARTS